MALFLLRAVPNAEAGDLDAPLGRFLSFVTNCPPISNLVVEMRLDAWSPTKLWQFRYSSNAFFARQFCPSNHNEMLFCASDLMCGRWEDQYWYYLPGGREPLLYEYRYSSDATNSGCYNMAVNLFNGFFGQLQSYGLSDGGLNSLTWKPPNLTSYDHYRNAASTITLHLSNNILTGASWMRQLAYGAVPHAYVAAFRYDGAVMPEGLPVEVSINTTQENIRVRSITLADPYRTIPMDRYFPGELFSNTNLARILYSNKTEYYVAHGKWRPMDVRLLPRTTNPDKTRQFYWLAVIALMALVIPLWLGFTKKTQTRKEP